MAASGAFNEAAAAGPCAIAEYKCHHSWLQVCESPPSKLRLVLVFVAKAARTAGSNPWRSSMNMSLCFPAYTSSSVQSLGLEVACNIEVDICVTLQYLSVSMQLFAFTVAYLTSGTKAMYVPGVQQQRHAAVAQTPQAALAP